MYSNLITRSTPKGKGVFAKGDILAGSIILEFKGDIFTSKTLPEYFLKNDFCLQIGLDSYVGASGSIDDLVNHSCQCNAYVKIVGNRAFLIALYLIKAGTEITFDYSTTSTDTLKDWSMACKCGVYSCRKVISGYQYLDPSVRQNYEALKIVPQYVKDSVK